MANLLEQTSHRPWPVSSGPWIMAQSWHDLLFAHWPVDSAILRPFIPAPLGVDTFDRDAWVGVVPFRMSGVRLRGTPALPWVSRFPELNVRTYVTFDGKPGVWFFSLDAGNPIAVTLARRWFHLPYFRARMRCQPVGGEIRYASQRSHPGTPDAIFQAKYRPASEPFQARWGTLEHFLTERYCLYAAAANRIFRGEIHHRPWQLQALMPTWHKTPWFWRQDSRCRNALPSCILRGARRSSPGRQKSLVRPVKNRCMQNWRTRTLDVQREGDQVGSCWWRDCRHFGAVHRAIKCVALHRHASCSTNQALQFAARRELRSLGTGIVINLLFHHRAIQVVCAESQCDLGDAGRQHDPICFDVVEVIQHQSGNRDIAQIQVPGRPGEVRKRGIVRMKRQRNKRHETAGLVLELAQFHQMVDPLFFGFHVTIQHGCV